MGKALCRDGGPKKIQAPGFLDMEEVTLERYLDLRGTLSELEINFCMLNLRDFGVAYNYDIN